MAKKAAKRSSNQSVRAPTALDFEIGARIREARKAAGRSQEQLAEALGTTFQQVQKYEAAKNRVAASRLVEIANFLNISPAWLLLGERADAPLDGCALLPISTARRIPATKGTVGNTS